MTTSNTTDNWMESLKSRGIIEPIGDSFRVLDFKTFLREGISQGHVKLFDVDTLEDVNVSSEVTVSDEDPAPIKK